MVFPDIRCVRASETSTRCWDKRQLFSQWLEHGEVRGHEQMTGLQNEGGLMCLCSVFVHPDHPLVPQLHPNPLELLLHPQSPTHDRMSYSTTSTDTVSPAENEKPQPQCLPDQMISSRVSPVRML